MINSNFNKKALEYDRHSQIQNEINRYVIRKFIQKSGCTNFVDLGCGTGNFGTYITKSHLKINSLLQLDSSPQMCKVASLKKIKAKYQFTICTSISNFAYLMQQSIKTLSNTNQQEQQNSQSPSLNNFQSSSSQFLGVFNDKNGDFNTLNDEFLTKKAQKVHRNGGNFYLGMKTEYKRSNKLQQYRRIIKLYQQISKLQKNQSRNIYCQDGTLFYSSMVLQWYKNFSQGLIDVLKIYNSIDEPQNKKLLIVVPLNDSFVEVKNKISQNLPNIKYDDIFLPLPKAGDVKIICQKLGLNLMFFQKSLPYNSVFDFFKSMNRIGASRSTNNIQNNVKIMRNVLKNKDLKNKIITTWKFALIYK
jgi:hypothetical protein